MADLPNRAEGYTPLLHDYSTMRGGVPSHLRSAAEVVSNLGGGMTQVTYVDVPTEPPVLNDSETR